jgi:hypothetical protein
VPTDLDLHLVLDNYATHKTAKVKEWLIRHPRFHLHFTPTSSSWMNLVERWFAELTNRKLRRCAHRSVTSTTSAYRAGPRRCRRASAADAATSAPTCGTSPIHHDRTQLRNDGRDDDKVLSRTRARTDFTAHDGPEHVRKFRTYQLVS